MEGVSNSVGLATESTETFEFFSPAPNAGAGSENSVLSVAKGISAHSFRHSLLLSELEW